MGEFLEGMGEFLEGAGWGCFLAGDGGVFFYVHM